MRHSLLRLTGTPIYLHPAALCQVSSASSAAGRSLARQRRLHALPPGGVGLPRTCLVSVPPDYSTTASDEPLTSVSRFSATFHVSDATLREDPGT